MVSRLSTSCALFLILSSRDLHFSDHRSSTATGQGCLMVAAYLLPNPDLRLLNVTRSSSWILPCFFHLFSKSRVYNFFAHRATECGPEGEPHDGRDLRERSRDQWQLHFTATFHLCHVRTKIARRCQPGDTPSPSRSSPFATVKNHAQHVCRPTIQVRNFTKKKQFLNIQSFHRLDTFW